MLPDDQVPSPLWVFGYGSLLWDPGFAVAEQRLARAQGYHRSFCMRSIHHRGSMTEPGLVLALDAARGASCQGVALRVDPGSEAQALADLRERELISSAYFEVALPLETENGAILSLAYVINPDHAQYCQLGLEEQAQIIATAQGGRGPNDAYLFNTAGHLAKLGITDPEMAWLVDRVRSLKAQG